MAETEPRKSSQPNRLINESSPYLLQHAHNPVDWHPWGAEAFQAARSLDRPIFLSVGYSTCYWCHVMERECFENSDIAALMNELFVCIKVDREERPDVDQLYMTAVQVQTQHGGWPMSVFLTPRLEYFYGGTYFPPVDTHGRAGFPTLLRAIAGAWQSRRADVEKSAAEFTRILSQLAEPTRPTEPLTIDSAFVNQMIERVTADYDPVNGGFGTAPKFPRQTELELLLTFGCNSATHRPQPATEAMVRHTLDALANGGIRDHLGGGFHRYSTDAKWLVPHFEIMLYDNAMLAWCYTEAFHQFGDARYARVARGVLDFVLREMTSPEGAFYTAFDAEVDAREGEPYLWTRGEVESVLGKGVTTDFVGAYGLDRGPNFADPHHGSGVPDRNVLYLASGAAMEDDPTIVDCRRKLLEVRARRKQPLLDTKIITSWNALMIRALAFAGRVLREDRYSQAARQAAAFLLQSHRTPDGGLWRTSRAGKPRHAAFLDDYAFLAQALYELGEQDSAATLVRQIDQRFASPGGGYYFSQAGADDLLVRQQTATDSPLPSGNGVMARLLVALGRGDDARRLIDSFARQLQQFGHGMSTLVTATHEYLNAHDGFDVASGAPGRAAPLQSDEALNAVSVEPVWGSPTVLRLDLKIADGFHIYAQQAPEGLAGTRLLVAGELASLVESTQFPDTTDGVYTGQIHIGVRFKSPPATGAILRFAVEYQPCSDRECLTVVRKPVEVTVP